jgi:RsiW-degrading membrane proteinase PrsW (M82 family)
MANEICCVCERPATRRLGARPYCDEDYGRATRPNDGLVRSIGIVVAGLLVFAVVVWLLSGMIGQPGPTALALIGLVLALVPAVAWLWFFYAQDRLEPEPHAFVIGVFLLAALVTDFLAPRVFAFFELSKWLASSMPTSLVLGSIFVRGTIYSLIAWAVVRYTVYPTSEFDERMDGIVYGTAAGLGTATMLNLNYVIDNGGVLMGPGVINIVVTALAQASFGGLIGYFLGEAKFVDEPVWWMPLGVLLATVANGLFLAASVLVKATGGRDVSEIWALVLAAGVAIVTFGALIMLMRRATAATLAAGPAN